MKTTYLDTETLGLYGPMAILQYQQDNGEPVLYSPWEMPAGVTRSLIQSIVKSRVERRQCVPQYSREIKVPE